MYAYICFKGLDTLLRILNGTLIETPYTCIMFQLMYNLLLVSLLFVFYSPDFDNDHNEYLCLTGIYFYKLHPIYKVDVLGTVVYKRERDDFFCYGGV